MGTRVALFDTHCHLFEPDFADDRPRVLERARRAGVTRILAVGCEPASWAAYLNGAASHPGLFLALGAHPNHAGEFGPERLRELRDLISAHRNRVAAVGETGLDFFRRHCPPDKQREAFRSHLDLAAEFGLPFVLHCRAAAGELLKILEDQRARQAAPLRGVWHSFAGTRDELQAAQDLGLHLAFNAVVTYPKADDVRAAARTVRDDRLLLETDAPWLPPQSRRGRRNEPAWLAETAERLAAERGVSTAELSRLTTANATALFESGERNGPDC